MNRSAAALKLIFNHILMNKARDALGSLSVVAQAASQAVLTRSGSCLQSCSLFLPLLLKICPS